MPRPKSLDLRLLSLRLRLADIDVARRHAESLGIPYQHVIREWVAQGAAALEKRKSVPRRTETR
jgi:predicted DNA binding CopG/RHH family protein